MNFIIVLLLMLIGVLQYDLWVGKGSVHDAKQLEHNIRVQKEENLRLKGRNEVLRAEVLDLKNGLETIEERARTELGMIKENETFFHVIDSRK